MNNRPPSCQAHNDHGTSTIICDRCGVQWDADDDDPPDCLSNLTDARVKPFKESKVIVVSTPGYGRTALNKLKEGLKS